MPSSSQRWSRIYLAIVATLLALAWIFLEQGEPIKRQIVLTQTTSAPGVPRSEALSESMKAAEPGRQMVFSPDLGSTTIAVGISDQVDVEPQQFGLEIRDHVAYLNGVPIDQIKLEDWKLEELENLLNSVRYRQVEVMIGCITDDLLKSQFITAADFSDQKLWFSEDVHFMTQRPYVSENKQVEFETGYARIPRSLAPDAYLLRDLVRRTYRTPAYSEWLLTQGLDYEQNIVRVQCPDAIAEITPDLAVWTFYSPSGKIVGQFYNTVNANN